MPTLVMQDGRPVALGASDIRRLVLMNQRDQMNQGGPFDREGARSRYAEQQQRRDVLDRQLLDQAMRERMQGRDIGAQFGLQDNQLRSRYAEQAMQNRARSDLSAQEAGQGLAADRLRYGSLRDLSQMDTDRQMGYLDRQKEYSLESMDRRAELERQAAIDNALIQQDEQFQAALDKVGLLAPSLNPEGRGYLQKVQDGLAEIDALPWSETEKMKQRQKLRPLLQKAMNQELIVSPTQQIGGWTYRMEGGKAVERLGPAKPDEVFEVAPGVYGIRQSDGSVSQVLSTGKGASSPTSQLDADKEFQAARAELQEQKYNQLVSRPGGAPSGIMKASQLPVDDQEVFDHMANRVQRRIMATRELAQPGFNRQLRESQDAALRQIDAGYEGPPTEAQMREGLPPRAPMQPPAQAQEPTRPGFLQRMGDAALHGIGSAIASGFSAPQGTPGGMRPAAPMQPPTQPPIQPPIQPPRPENTMQGMPPSGPTAQAQRPQDPAMAEKVQRLEASGYASRNLLDASRIMREIQSKHPNAKTIDDLPENMRLKFSQAQLILDIANGRR